MYETLRGLVVRQAGESYGFVSRGVYLFLRACYDAMGARAYAGQVQIDGLVARGGGFISNRGGLSGYLDLGAHLRSYVLHYLLLLAAGVHGSITILGGYLVPTSNGYGISYRAYVLMARHVHYHVRSRAGARHY